MAIEILIGELVHYKRKQQNLHRKSRTMTGTFVEQDGAEEPLLTADQHIRRANTN